MYTKLLNFIKYNNAFTIIIWICFFSFGVTFAAANPAVRESLYSSTETITSVDNQLIISSNLDNFNFNLIIGAIAEDNNNYYVSYSYQTMVVENGVWQKKNIEKVLTVNKEALAGKDLGLYATKELGDNINYELSYLKRTQKLEVEKGESQKVVTTQYAGLIGKLLDPKEMVIDGYEPVIPEVVPEVPAPKELNPEPEIIDVPTEEIPDNPTVDEATTTPDVTPEPEPVTDATTTPEVVPEPITDATTTPEVVPEPVTDATTTPEVVPEPVTDATTTPEVAPEPEQTEENASSTDDVVVPVE